MAKKSGEWKGNIAGCSRIVFCTICSAKFTTVANSKRMICTACYMKRERGES